ncbi:MAG: hypothetical protein ACI37P_05960 [Eggerthellaceae bacterium]
MTYVTESPKNVSSLGKALRLVLAVSLALFVAVPLQRLAAPSAALAEEVTLDWVVEAQYGYQLKDYRLPGGWSWDNPDAYLSAVGDTTAQATYSPKNPGATGDYAEGDVAQVSLQVKPREVQLAWSSTDVAYLGAPVQIQAQVVNAAFQNDVFAFTYGKGSNTASAPGTYVAKVTSVGNSNYVLPADESACKVTWNVVALSTGKTASVIGKKGSAPNKAGWLKEAAVVVPPSGFAISSDGKTFKSKLSVTLKQGSTKVSYYLQDSTTKQVTNKKSVTAKVDTKAPSISSAKATSTSTTATVKVKASDATSGVASYKLSGLPKGAKVTQSGSTFRITGLSAGHSYTMSVAVTDAAGNVATKTVKFATTAKATSSSSGSTASGSTTSGSSARGTSGSTVLFEEIDPSDDEYFDDEDESFTDEDLFAEEDEDFSDEDLFADEDEEGYYDDEEFDDADAEFYDADVAWDDESADGESGEEPYTGPLPLIIAGLILAAAVGGRALARFGKRKFSEAVAAEVARQIAQRGD